MGFRLMCKHANKSSIYFYGTKLYGYYKDIDNLPSIKYLASIGVRQAFGMDDDTSFEDYFNISCCTPDMTLTHEQFLIFITLYCFDWNFTVDKTHFINKDFDNFLKDDEIIKKLIDSNDDIIICWE